MKPGSFTDVAMLLVNGNDPKRLAVALASYAPLIGIRKPTKEDDRDDKLLLDAAKVLERGLREYSLAEDEFGLECPDCVDTVLGALPELIEYLETQRRPPRKGGKAPDSRRLVCANVCAEAWRHYHHREAQPFSLRLQEACEEYWQRCGNRETGEANGSIRNWERFLRQVVDANDEEFRENFLHYITIPK